MRRAGEVLAAFEALPETADPTVIGRRPMILAPHPDDESLGCGGLIAASCAVQNWPIVVILTDGAASHPGSKEFPPPRLARLRQAEALAAVAELGLPADRLVFLDFPDAAMPESGADFAAAAARLAALAREQDCGAIVGPWVHDPHGDHVAGARLAAAVAVAAGLPLCAYPVWGWLLPPATRLDETRAAGWRLDIAAWLPAKQRAIARHRSQYDGLINDSPNGFSLPPELLAVFERNFEVFIT